jgi:hypothetical protein
MPKEGRRRREWRGGGVEETRARQWRRTGEARRAGSGGYLRWARCTKGSASRTHGTRLGRSGRTPPGGVQAGAPRTHPTHRRTGSTQETMLDGVRLPLIPADRRRSMALGGHLGSVSPVHCCAAALLVLAPGCSPADGSPDTAAEEFSPPPSRPATYAGPVLELPDEELDGNGGLTAATGIPTGAGVDETGTASTHPPPRDGTGLGHRPGHGGMGAEPGPGRLSPPAR